MNPITVEMLREDWASSPTMTGAVRESLSALPDEVLQTFLDRAFQANIELWWAFLDSTRADATRALKASVEREIVKVLDQIEKLP